jgi:hypothetical protein
MNRDDDRVYNAGPGSKIRLKANNSLLSPDDFPSYSSHLTPLGEAYASIGDPHARPVGKSNDWWAVGIHVAPAARTKRDNSTAPAPIDHAQPELRAQSSGGAAAAARRVRWFTNADQASHGRSAV